MTAHTLTRASLALLFIAALAGCSAVVDPSTGQVQGQKVQAAPAEDMTEPEKQPPAMAPAASAAEIAEVDQLRRENQSLKVQQAQSQARLDTLTKQMAQEREEQRRFREMMTTNFDLLEQSVVKSLAHNMDRGPASKAEGQNAAPAPKPANAQGKQANKTAAPGPAMTPPPAEAQENAPAEQDQGPMALQPMPYWDENGGKSAAPSQAAQFETKRPESQMSEPERPPRQAAAQPPKQAPALPGTDGKVAANAQAPKASAAQASTAQAAPLAPVPVMLPAPGKEGAALSDPDLVPPTNPRTLSAHPEAKPLYEKGFVHFAKGDYAEAVRVYEDFIVRFPDDNHTDNALFWLGEAHLQLKDSRKADAAYRAVLRNFAHKSTLEGYKTPDAIYKLGQMSLMGNDSRRAEYYFRNVSERFPESTAGKKAQRELDAIRVNTAGTENGTTPEG